MDCSALRHGDCHHPNFRGRQCRAYSRVNDSRLHAAWRSLTCSFVYQGSWFTICCEGTR